MAQEGKEETLKLIVQSEQKKKKEQGMDKHSKWSTTKERNTVRRYTHREKAHRSRGWGPGMPR